MEYEISVEIATRADMTDLSSYVANDRYRRAKKRREDAEQRLRNCAPQRAIDIPEEDYL